ncbi:MAG: hypothetical protein HRU00_05610 [Myxococcales bacterium]|nr:hypothetical protein [Myxococcales bacterium]
MRSKEAFVRRGVLWIMLVGLLAPTYGAAQVAVTDAPEADAREITRDATGLQAELRVADRDFVDTALVFTNTGRERARVTCRAFDANGRHVGRIRLDVPPGGLRFALASDLSYGRDFIGRVQCSTQNRVLASSVLLAPHALTDLGVQQLQGIGSILFPVVATY